MDSVGKRFGALHACLFLFLALSGCGSFLQRPRPSKEDYIVDYFAYFDTAQIEKLDYVYQGSIGGAGTVGRAKFKDSVKLRESLIAAQVKCGLLEDGIYDPTAMEEIEAVMFREQWEEHAGGTMPRWFDFPFDRKLRMLREAGEGSDAHPRHETVWYIDEDRNVVYVRGNWG
jgi:hypothetical protein